MPQPLAGLLIVDFTTLLPGPLATLMLAEAGAEVIKIERPGGENMRRYEPRFGGESAMFAMLNRGKKSVVLDLKSDAGRARLMPLIKRADVVVEQFRPGVMARLGLGPRLAEERARSGGGVDAARIREAILTHGSATSAARELGISRDALIWQLRKQGLGVRDVLSEW